MMHHADVAIAGGGPAGCAAAIMLARAGHAVTLIDPDLPRCDVPESLHEATAGLLRDMGASQVLETCVHQAVPDLAPGVSLHVERARFDRALRAVATGMGVRLITGTVLEPAIEDGIVAGLDCDGCQVRARLTIDASGPQQMLRRRLGLARHMHAPPLIAQRGFADVTGAVEAGFTATADGWSWTVLLAHDRAAWTTLGRAPGPPEPKLPSGLLPDRDFETINRRWCSVATVAGPGWLIAGEAGAILDPAAGDGVVLALESGRNAGLAAARMLAPGLDPSLTCNHYQRWWDRRVGAKIRGLAAAYVQTGFGFLLAR